MWLYIVGGLVVVYILHYLFNVVKKPEIYVKKGEFSNFIKAHCTALNEHYWPNVWCFHAHLLTTFSNIYRGKMAGLKFHREYLITPDGGQISLDWYEPDRDSILHGRNLPIAIYVPALISHSRAEYFRALVPSAHSLGYRPVILNYRGLGGNKLLTERLNCGASFDDLKCAVEHIREQNPSARITGIGFSMGASILGGYLIAAEEQSVIDSAFLVSTCWDFKEGSDNLNKGFLNRRFNRILTGMLLKKLAQGRVKYENEPWFIGEQHKYCPEQIRKAQSIREFDEAFTSKMFGFVDADDYYRAATMTGRVNRIRVPTLSINAADDMIAPVRNLPMSEISSSDKVAMAVTARGGHIGFMDSFLPTKKPTYLLERVFEQYLTGLKGLKQNPRELFA